MDGVVLGDDITTEEAARTQGQPARCGHLVLATPACRHQPLQSPAPSSLKPAWTAFLAPATHPSPGSPSDRYRFTGRTRKRQEQECWSPTKQSQVRPLCLLSEQGAGPGSGAGLRSWRDGEREGTGAHALVAAGTVRELLHHLAVALVPQGLLLRAQLRAPQAGTGDQSGVR